MKVKEPIADTAIKDLINEENKMRKKFNTNIEYSISGEVIMTDFKELDSYLDSTFLPNCINYQKKKKILSPDEPLKYVKLHDIENLNLNEVEMEHVMNYLQRKNISVNGCSTSLNGRFENYNQKYSKLSYKMKYPKPLPKEEQKKLFEEYSKTKDKEIKNKLIEHNMAFVFYLSAKYVCITGIEQEDVESYGFLGLIKAIDNYDSEKGEFSTIASYHITKNIINGIAQLQGFKAGKFYSDYNLARKKVESKRCELLRENLELVDEVVESLIEKKAICEKYREENKTRIMLGHTMLFDDLLEEKLIDDNTLYNQTLDIVENQQLRQTLDSLFDILNDKEKEVIIKRFGFDDGEEKTLDKIGKELNISVEAVRMRQKRALNKIKKSRKMSLLKEFYDNESIDYSYDPKGLVKVKK